MPSFNEYDYIIVAFSGGKDSISCVLDLLERGVPANRIELWHHLVDGQEGSCLMDWPVTHDYCKAFARAMGIKIRFSWKVGGFEREMLRNNTLTAPTKFEDDTGKIIECGGTSGKPGIRMKFPQVSADLSVRWCSAYLKIDVCASAIRNQSRFLNKKTLVITGERAEESAARAKYKVFEPDRSDNRNGKRVIRHVDHWRPVHAWSEERIWSIIERFRINPHPAYRLGWGRLSCMTCIFGSPNQWASVRECYKVRFDGISDYEEQFRCTIHRTESVDVRADKGKPYDAIISDKTYYNSNLLDLAMGDKYRDEIIVYGDWVLPEGAFGESTGPT